MLRGRPVDNTTTLITLLVGALRLYVTLFVVLVAAEVLLLDRGVLAEALSRAPRWSDELAIAWFLSSASLIGGALGSGFEDDSVVRRVAMVYDNDSVKASIGSRRQGVASGSRRLAARADAFLGPAARSSSSATWRRATAVDSQSSAPTARRTAL